MGSRFKGCGGGFAASVYETMPESDIAAIYTPRRFLTMSVVTLLLSPSLGRGTPEGQGVGRRRNRAKPTSFQRKEGKAGCVAHLPPSPGRGMPEGQGVGRRRNRAKPTSGATRHLLPEEGGRSRMRSPSIPFPWKGIDGQGVGRAKHGKCQLNRSVSF